MASTFGGLEIGKRALFTQRAALTTTSHNIANANTEGYTRQRANMKATYAIPVPGLHNDRTPGQVGTGVEVTNITRLREGFLDKQYRLQNSEAGYWESKSMTLEMVENVFNEPSDSGLQASLDQFWQSWQNLSKDAKSMANREIVVQKAIAVAGTFQDISSSLKGLISDTEKVLDNKLTEMNSIGEQIRSLNEEISRIVPHGYVPNDLYDQRDLLVDKLSKLVSIKEVPAKSGMVDIYIEGENGTLTNFVEGISPPSMIDSSVEPKGGEILALKQALGDANQPASIQSYLTQIDSLAREIATVVNDAHRNGVNLEDIQNGVAYGSGQRLPFFVNASGGDPQSAEDMMVNPDLLSNVNKIAASTQGVETVGDGSNALEIAKLKFTTIAQLGDTSPDHFYRFTISQLGIDGQSAQRNMKNADITLNSIDMRRQSVSGVSLDEEMTDMIKYQQAYNAASRNITSIDEMLDKLINGTGRVGL